MIERNRIWQPWFLATVLAVGFGIVWATAMVWCLSMVAERSHSLRLIRRPVVRADGAVILECFMSNCYMNRHFETLDGKRADVHRRDPMMDGTWLVSEKESPEMPWFYFWDRRAKPVSEQRATRWYIIHDGQKNGKAYFVGYDLKDCQCIGYLGRNGFQLTEPAPEDQFAIRLREAVYSSVICSGDEFRWRRNDDFEEIHDQAPAGSRIPPWMIYLISGDQLVTVNLRARTVKVVRELPNMITVGGVEPLKKKSKEKGKRWTTVDNRDLLAVRTDQAVVVLDPQGREVRRFPIPKSLQTRDFQFYQVDPTTALIQTARALYHQGGEKYRFVWLNNQGDIQREELCRLPSYSFMNNAKVEPWIAGAMIPVPILYTPGVLTILPSRYVESGEAADPSGAVGTVLADLWPLLLLINASGVVLAWLCYRRQKRYAQPWTWVWVGFVLLFGLPAFVGYLFHRRWPAEAACPACEATVPRDREACFACGEEFPTPAPTGVEIFA